MTVVSGVEEARRKLRLIPPFTVRYAVENRFPRIYVTNHLRRRSLHTTFGPFASRLAAEGYREAVEDLFLIRRCFMELHPSPDDPGCIYGEMGKCIRPCQARCSDESYRAEAERALDFLRTRGASLVTEAEREREHASTGMMFEEAAAAHGRVGKARSVAVIADPLVQPLDELRAIVLVPLAPSAKDHVPRAQIFLFADGVLRGPEIISLLGVRLAKEQAEVGSSLFAQPLMLAPVPLETSEKRPPEDVSPPREIRALPHGPGSHAGSAEEQMLGAVTRLEELPGAEGIADLGDHLAMLRRWYYRPEKQREGLLFQRENDAWPVRRILRAAAKVLAERAKQSAAAEGGSAHGSSSTGSGQQLPPAPLL